MLKNESNEEHIRRLEFTLSQTECLLKNISDENKIKVFDLMTNINNLERVKDNLSEKLKQTNDELK